MAYNGKPGGTPAGNKKDAPDAATVLDLLGADNRTVVASPDPGDPTKVLVASGLVADAKAIKVGNQAGTYTDAGTVKDVDGGTLAGDGIASGQGALATTAANTVKVPIMDPTDTTSLRTQYFIANPGQKGGGVVGGMKPIDYTKRVCMLVNQFGEPLKLDGTLAAAADIVDANAAVQADGTVQDSTWDGAPIIAAAGKPHEGQDIGPVYNWSQTYRKDRTGPVGVYDVEPRQTGLYTPYVGWTAQNTPRADAR